MYDFSTLDEHMIHFLRTICNNNNRGNVCTCFTYIQTFVHTYIFALMRCIMLPVIYSLLFCQCSIKKLFCADAASLHFQINTHTYIYTYNTLLCVIYLHIMKRVKFFLVFFFFCEIPYIPAQTVHTLLIVNVFKVSMIYFYSNINGLTESH